MREYNCGHCGYNGPAYGQPMSNGCSAPWCPNCERNDKLVLVEKDVPKQYKKAVDAAVLDLMDAAKKLWPIVEELGETFTCSSDDFVIEIKRR